MTLGLALLVKLHLGMLSLGANLAPLFQEDPPAAPTGFTVDVQTVLSNAYLIFGSIAALLMLIMGIALAKQMGRFFRSLFGR